MKICCVEGCKNKRDGTSRMCGKHRRRLRLYGDPHKTKNNPPGEGFLARGYKGFQIDGVKKFEHVLIAERVLGRPLPNGAVVHHANGIKSDNRNENLVICPSRAYHNLLHARIDAFLNSGDPFKRKCRKCGKYDDMSNLVEYITKAGTSAFWHRKSKSKMGLEKANMIRNASGTQREIAEMFGIDQSTVSAIKNNKIWKE